MIFLLPGSESEKTFSWFGTGVGPVINWTTQNLGTSPDCQSLGGIVLKYE